MKDKILNALKSKTFFALAINIVIMALIIVVTAFSYDSADDFYNSLYICQYHNYYNNDINYIFATITGSLQYILLNFNCFVLFQILLSCSEYNFKYTNPKRERVPFIPDCIMCHQKPCRKQQSGGFTA